LPPNNKQLRILLGEKMNNLLSSDIVETIAALKPEISFCEAIKVLTDIHDKWIYEERSRITDLASSLLYDSKNINVFREALAEEIKSI
jgi:hypothetical protein